MKERAAYQTMFRFLEDRYRRLPSDALGGLLGEMQLADDGEPFDPAIGKEWDEAVAATDATRSINVVPHRKAS
jgi:hypothetical protein